MLEDLEDVLRYHETAARYLVSIKQPESADAHRDDAEKIRRAMECMKEGVSHSKEELVSTEST